jgi:hypothetical protein
VGSLLAYSQPKQAWTLYEIDPAVVNVAEDPRWFTFLAHARAPYTVVLGDARLSLASTDDRFDLLVLDAYSSDSVPVHLLTVEAVKLYRDRLRPGGLLAMHISNHHLDLIRVVAGIARDLGLACIQQSASANLKDLARGITPSRWALLARSRDDFGPLGGDPRWAPPPLDRPLAVWTDDYSSIVQVWSEPR